LPAGVDAAGNLISLFDQDRSLWDKTLVIEGLRLLELSAAGPNLSGVESVSVPLTNAGRAALQAPKKIPD